MVKMECFIPKSRIRQGHLFFECWVLSWVKITADSDCSHEIKRLLLKSLQRLLVHRKAMTNLDSIWKSRVINLLTKVCLVKAMIFPVVIYGCESWTIKKGEHRRIDVFELWCWKRLFRALWTVRGSNSQS